MNSISITGKGSIHVAPDVTRLETTIEQWFKTYEEAYIQARENSSWFVKILEYNHKPGKLAKTTRFDISDHIESKYDEDGDVIGHFKMAMTSRSELRLICRLTINLSTTLCEASANSSREHKSTSAIPYKTHARTNSK